MIILTNLEIAKNIIKSGIAYIKKNLKNYDVRLADVKKAISDYENGRKRYTKSDIDRLKKIFNRSRLKSNSYKTVSIPINVQTIRTENGNFAIDYVDTINVRVTASQDEKTAISRELAKKVNTEAKQWASKLNDDLHDQFIDMVSEIDDRFRNSIASIENGGDIIDMSKLKNLDDDDYLAFTDAIERIREFAPLSADTQTALKNFMDQTISDFEQNTGLSVNDSRGAYRAMMENIQINSYDSYSERDIKIAFYEYVKPSGLFQQAFEIFQSENVASKIVEKLKQLGRR